MKNSLQEKTSRFSRTRLVFCIVIFITFFLLTFLYMHFVGPKEQAGIWVRHEPLSVDTSLVTALLVALGAAAYAAIRRR
jgi:MYXO-CTERM domain-containing protein